MSDCKHKREGLVEIGALVKPYCKDCSKTMREINLEIELNADRERIEKAEAIITSEISFGPKYRDWNKILEAVLILRKESSET